MKRSAAYEAFTSNRADVDRLMQLHGDISGSAPGRKYGVAVLNKSAIVLLCASWEAYCEDIVSEVVQHYVDHAPEPNALPPALRNRIATELHSDKMLMWTLAGDGWRAVLASRLADLKVERDRKLNTPKTSQIKALFADHAGYLDITQEWHWPRRKVESACDTLDEFVALRGAIAHRVEADSAVHKATVTKYTRFVGRLVQRIDDVMVAHAKTITGEEFPHVE